MNNAYQAKFNFPFIVAVRGMQRAAIITAIERRIANTLEQEIDTALHEIGLIAQCRLNDILSTDELSLYKSWKLYHHPHPPSPRSWSISQPPTYAHSCYPQALSLLCQATAY